MSATADSALFGRHPGEGLVALDYREQDGQGLMRLYLRDADGLRVEEEPFEPYLWLSDPELARHAPGATLEELQGGEVFSHLLLLPGEGALRETLALLKKETGYSATDAEAPYFLVSDLTQQYLMRTGRTLFKGLDFSCLKRLQLDIETYTGDGYEFPNAARESDRVIAIALADESGWTEVLSGKELEEKDLLRRFVEIVRERDPDVIEGHNLFQFDLPYLFTRAQRHRVPMCLGRDGEKPRVRSSRFGAGERTITYPRCDIVGRHVIDTYFLAQLYDLTQRSLPGYGLKEVARHFGVSPDGRTYVEGGAISDTYDRDPDRVMKYAHDDIVETRGVAAILTPITFAQTQLLPMNYQQVAVRGQAGKIDALMLRACLEHQRSVPRPSASRHFAGGYTDIFETGICRPVEHCDIQSLYPSLMLKHRLGPARDSQGVFLSMLEHLRAYRLDAKRRMREEPDPEKRRQVDALQSAFKILINSFYGYLGFAQAHFNDYDAAETVAAEGRKLLQSMIDWLRERHARPVEIDTDGIYFVPPPGQSDAEREAFERAMQNDLPEGIDVEFDGRYVSMFSYKMKNYALLDEQGEMTLKGAALKSRGLEPFQRDFMRELLRALLEDRARDIPLLRKRYEEAIQERRWPVETFAKTETLQENPSAYAAKLKRGGRGRSAAYELALRSERDYGAGDQVSYYVTGSRKSVAVHEAAKLCREWDPQQRDENVPYYLAKLDALHKKFAEWAPQSTQMELL